MKKFKFFFTLLLSWTTLTVSLPVIAEENVAKQVENDFRSVAKKAIPAVVSIQVKSGIKNTTPDTSYDPFDFFGDDLFSRFFFRYPQGQRAPTVGQGSGFLISADGLILTNSHVVNEADEMLVLLNDGREFNAKLIGQDTSTDVALIKIDGQDFPYLTLSNSDQLEVGQWVIAIGNPLGLQASLTVGVVSAKGRNNLDLTRIEDFIQTDAAINRGNSGGPLLTMDGEVAGINTAIASGSGGYMGIGFAIPSNIARYDVDQILEKGNVTRGFIGVALQQIDQNLAAALEMSRPEGALVAEVTKGSPAEKAGLRQGDVIVKYNNQKVANVGAFRNAIALMKPGTHVNLSVIRLDKTTQEINVEVGEYPNQTVQLTQGVSKANRLGIEVQTVSAEIARKHSISEAKGVVITKVLPGSVAAWAGLKSGMLILSVNQQGVNTSEEFEQAVTNSDNSKPVLLLIRNGETVRYISLKTS